MISQRRVPLLLLLAIATVFGVSSSVQAYWLSLVTRETVPMRGHLFVLNRVYWYVPALLAPIVMRGAWACQIGRGRWPLPLLFHITGAFLFSVVHTAAMLGTRALLMPAPQKGWWFAVQVEYLTQLD